MPNFKAKVCRCIHPLVIQPPPIRLPMIIRLNSNTISHSHHVECICFSPRPRQQYNCFCFDPLAPDLDWTATVLRCYCAGCVVLLSGVSTSLPVTLLLQVQQVGRHRWSLLPWSFRHTKLPRGGLSCKLSLQYNRHNWLQHDFCDPDGRWTVAPNQHEGHFTPDSPSAQVVVRFLISEETHQDQAVWRCAALYLLGSRRQGWLFTRHILCQVPSTGREWEFHITSAWDKVGPACLFLNVLRERRFGGCLN